MDNHERLLDAQVPAGAQNLEVAQKLQESARSSHTAANPKQVVEPPDDQIRKLLQNPQQFRELYDKYCGDLYYKSAEPQSFKWVSKESLEAVLKKPEISGDERLVAAASLAAFDNLAHAVGNHITNTDVAVLDGTTGDRFAQYMGGKSKAEKIKEIETNEIDHPGSFVAWFNDQEKSFPEPLGPLVPVLTGCVTGSGIYGAALTLGAAPAVGLAVLGGAAATVAITGIEYGISQLSDYFHASSKYESKLKELKTMTQSASLPANQRSIQ